MTRFAPFLLMIALLPLAGCIGGEDAPVDSATADGPSASGSAAQVAGGAANPAQAAPATGAPIVTPVDWDGTTATGFCAPSGLNACSGMSLGASNTFLTVDVIGNATGELTLTWDAATPATQTFRFDVSKGTSCGNSCVQWGEDTVTATGGSPLVVAFDFEIDEGSFIVVSVAQPRQTPSPVYGRVSTEQPFHVEGTISSTA